MKIIQKIKTIIPLFNEKQLKLHELNIQFQKELKILEENANTVDNMIMFLQKLPSEQKDDEIVQNIIQQMNVLCKKIMNKYQKYMLYFHKEIIFKNGKKI